MFQTVPGGTKRHGMKISLNWLKDYLAIDLSPAQVGEILTDIGLEVEGMEEIQSIPGGLAGVVVGEVLECGPHPNADRLSLTKVDLGNGDPVQIVCGAPNVAAGQKVMVATVGTTLHPLEGEPFELKKGKIRGEVSEGMICAEDELGLGHDHEGILVLPEDTPVGLPAREYFQVETDVVYEIGLTPNRSDATNHLGVAYDLAAALKINHGHDGRVKRPSVDDFGVDNHDLPVEVTVENYEACPRYSGLTIKGLRIEESPEWLKRRLRAVGVRPINNVVDITNFILHELGQPLHAFDLDKIGSGRIVVKTLPGGTPFTTLDEVARKLSAQDLMICDGDAQGMCIGGVFGGIGTGVTAKTVNIFLESAHFDSEWIRRTSMRHNLRTDAARVFEKGSDPNLTVYALKRAAMLMKELAGGEVAGEVIDLYPEPIRPVRVEVAYAHINRLIGVDLPRQTVRDILEALKMEIQEEGAERFTVAVPTNKADVTREADIIEEILRIYGFNNVPMPAKITTTMAIGQYPDPGEVRQVIGNYLAASGFNEMMAVSLSESRYYREILPSVGEEELVYVNNTSNVHLDIMRPTMLFSGLEAIVHNQNRQQTNIKLFEFGKTYRRAGQAGFDEPAHLSLFIAGDRRPESWLNQGKNVSDFYTLKGFVEQVLTRLGINGYQESAVEGDAVFSYGLRYHRGPRELVTFGKVSPAVAKPMDVRGEVYYADFQWDLLLRAASRQTIQYEELNKYPSVRRDLALIIDNSVKFNDIVAIAKKTGKKLIKEINLFDVYENEEQLGKGKKSYAVSFLFEDPSKTLKDKEVDKVIKQLIDEYESKLGATIRK